MALAKSSQKLEVEATSCPVNSHWLAAGDEAGHSVGIQQRQGDSKFSDGTTAKYTTVSTIDFRRGKGGTSTGYSKFTFEDGSLIIFSWKAKVTIGEGGLSYNEGQGKIIKGAGRFEGIEGSSVFAGRQLKPLAEDPKGTVLQNATITFKLPRKD